MEAKRYSFEEVMVNKFEADTDDTIARDLTIQNTNEIAWDYYTVMRGISSLALKDGNYNVEDVMRSIMDAYETRYHEIIKGHENGDREVSYELTGKRSLTLEEDLPDWTRLLRCVFQIWRVYYLPADK